MPNQLHTVHTAMAHRALSLWLIFSAISCNQCVLARLTVHVIPHSHCDAGYEKTFDDYFESEVRDILDTMTEALEANPNRRFVWEEVSFLKRWWEGASDRQRALMRNLTANGQLEFIGGGWVMHDEATTNIFGTLNQMTVGLRFLNATLGVRPSVEWHIDPFGHSQFMPELYTLLGYKAVIINRVPDPVKQEMKRDKGLEFFWRNPHTNNTIFTHVLDSHYTTTLLGITIEERAKFLVRDIALVRQQWYKTDHLLVPFGGDFAFQNADKDFKEMDEIIDYINSRPEQFSNITVKYSNLSNYIDAVLRSGVTFNTLDRDFFPYVCCSPCGAEKCGGVSGFLSGDPCGEAGTTDSYWSGFFTSKPAEKLLVREQESLLRALEGMNSLFPDLAGNISSALELSRNTSALLQHHDAITGTSYPQCYCDYMYRLRRALTIGGDTLGILKETKLCGKSGTYNFSSDAVTTLSGLTGGNVAAVVIQNHLDVERDHYMAVPLPQGLSVEVLTATTEPVESQQVGSSLFFAVHLPPLATRVVFLKKTQHKHPEQFKVSGFSLSNGATKLTFDANNHLYSWSSVEGSSHRVNHSYVQYRERKSILEVIVCDGTNVYTFVPDEGRDILTPEYVPTIITANGPLVWEAEQTINEYITATIRLFKPPSNVTGVYHSDVEWKTRIGALPFDPANTVSSFFTTDLHTNNTFTTYSNGFYPTVRSYNTSTRVQGNTYPLVGRAAINDMETGDTFSIISQRPVGTNGVDNSIEVSLHRRIFLLLDERGNDMSIMNDSILVGFSKKGSGSRGNTVKLFQSPPSVHYTLVESIGGWLKTCEVQWDPAAAGFSLPQGLHVLSRELLKVHTSDHIEIGIRFINEGHSVTIDIGSMLSNWIGGGVKETTPDFLVTTNAQPCQSGTEGPNLNLEKGNRRGRGGGGGVGGGGGRGNGGGGWGRDGGGGVCFVQIKTWELKSFVIKLEKK